MMEKHMKKTFDALESKDFNEQELLAIIHENNPMIYLYTRSFKLKPQRQGRLHPTKKFNERLRSIRD